MFVSLSVCVTGSCVESLGVQGASLGKVTAVADALAAVDAVKLADVQTVCIGIN